MIDTFWNNLRPPDGSAPIILTIGAAGGTGLLQQVIDLGTVYNRGELAGIEVEVTNGVVAPGSTKDLTVYYAFCSKQNRTAVQLAAAAASQACRLTNTASLIQDFMLPVNYQGARYLHIWFDCTSMTAGSVITIELRVNAKTAN